jgi:hypothetical protein
MSRCISPRFGMHSNNHNRYDSFYLLATPLHNRRLTPPRFKARVRSFAHFFAYICSQPGHCCSGKRYAEVRCHKSERIIFREVHFVDLSRGWAYILIYGLSDCVTELTFWDIRSAIDLPPIQCRYPADEIQPIPYRSIYKSVHGCVETNSLQESAWLLHLFVSFLLSIVPYLTDRLSTLRVDL